MEHYFQKVEESAAYLKAKLQTPPKLLLVLTGGLQKFLETIKDQQIFKSTEISHFPAPKAEGHTGQIIFGRFQGLPVAVMMGRSHYYEGLSPQEVVFPYFVFNKLGVDQLITTNAVGGIRTDLKGGDIMAVTDHINMMGTNPLIGISVLTPSDQFTSMQKAYDPEWIKMAQKIAKQNKVVLKKGVFLGTTGPSYETPAEIKAFRSLGADTVGMSTIFEIITARYLKMRVLTLNMIANPSADRHKGEMTHKEVLQTIQKSQEKMVRLLKGVVSALVQK
ncbi:MAG: purine-nucleoside phosphorylase [Deltaproteobacteria bacterium]|nr:purine-nucleoside phosphorylase [Deltaproteobacteria bacterium]